MQFNVMPRTQVDFDSFNKTLIDVVPYYSLLITK